MAGGVAASKFLAARLSSLRAFPTIRTCKRSNFPPEDHPTEGKITIPDIAVQFGRTPGSIDRLQPKLGEHSIEILREAGYSDADIEVAGHRRDHLTEHYS